MAICNSDLETLVNGVCTRKESFFGGKPVLSKGVGYAVVLGYSLLFAVLTNGLIYLDTRFSHSTINSEFFNTAGRNVKTGLIASVIVSTWTWAATLLQSSNVAYKYGISGPFWYASGATIQVLLFGTLAIEIKRKAPNAHTICEIVKARWGTLAHVTFLFFCFLTSCIVSAMLMLGGSAVVEALTGANLYAASFLIPMGVVIYTLHGGLKATFVAHYLNAAVLNAVLLIFIYLVYTTSSKLGSPSVMYEKLKALAEKTPEECTTRLKYNQQCGKVSGNYNGSFMTMLSTNGFVFGIINIVGNFGTVFVDNSYWMSAIAAKPTSTHKGYLLGGLIWFCIPFSLGTSLGIGSLALDLPVTASEANAGLVPPATAVALMGKGGAFLILTMLFMAVTSSASSELISLSTLVCYDIYKTYINTEATGSTILFLSRVMVCIFGVFMGVLAVLLNAANVSLGWMYVTMGVMIGSAVMPVAFLLTWKKANAIGAIAGCWGGAIIGLASWLTTAGIEYGRINLDVTGRNAPALVGNLVAILAGGLIHVVFSLISPDDYDWVSTKAIEMLDADGDEADPEEYDDKQLDHAFWWVLKWGSLFTFIMVIAWPLLTLPAKDFNKGYFTFWAVVSVAWGTVASVVLILLPIYESLPNIIAVFLGIFGGGSAPEKATEEK